MKLKLAGPKLHQKMKIATPTHPELTNESHTLEKGSVGVAQAAANCIRTAMGLADTPWCKL
eukprot:CAMPEP_0183508758 /NCGR_PEP_ID=MMETSP0371-20130417/9097_1 /TAXON_ID=268820 /ORGANISM="Peridinium aciculiferum, Strain PAER-2" /LENGTH=60 /DNA_ID=CAMNT_0025705205 /DNA_START=109 /DNA_END=289 /DNA_ORIENTATION=+